MREARERLPGAPSIAAVARQAGMAPSVLSRLERGERAPRVETLLALAQALAVPPEELLARAGYASPAGDSPPAGLYLRGLGGRPADPIREVEGALLRGGWSPDLVRAIVRLCEVTRPR